MLKYKINGSRNIPKAPLASLEAMLWVCTWVMSLNGQSLDVERKFWLSAVETRDRKSWQIRARVSRVLLGVGVFQ